MTEEDAKFIKENLSKLELIKANQSISGVTIEFRDRLNKIGAHNCWNYCSSCNSGFFRLVALCLEHYYAYEKEQKPKARSTKTNSRKSKSSVSK